MKYLPVVSASYRQFEELIQKEMDLVGEKRQELYRSLYDSVKYNKDNVDVIRMKQLMEKGEDTEILKIIPIVIKNKKVRK